MSLEIEKLPKLGFGMMRLPKQGEEIDEEKVKEMVDLAMDNGINYFDSAYVYGDGKSEEMVRKAVVERYPRDKFYVTSKLPSWHLKDFSDRDRILHESLERLGVDYIDFYLLHAVQDGQHNEDYKNFDCYDWAVEKKREGKIKHFGFSYHGSPKLLEQILDNHPEIEFVQIQLNYEDWESPVVYSGELYRILLERSIPVIVMEPVKGGRLAEPEEEVKEMLKEISPDESPAALALRFAASLDNVAVVLSGMSNIEQMKENVEIFSNFKPLSKKEYTVIKEIQNWKFEVRTSN